MTMITPSYLGETIEYSSLHACRSTLEDPTNLRTQAFAQTYWQALLLITGHGSMTFLNAILSTQGHRR